MSFSYEQREDSYPNLDTKNRKIDTSDTNTDIAPPQRLANCDIRTNDNDVAIRSRSRKEDVEISGSTATNENTSTDLGRDDSDNHGDIIAFKLSPRRWAILFGICTYGFLNGIANETNPIQSTIVSLLEIKLEQYIYLSQIFLYIVPLNALPSAWFLDKYGLKVVAYTSIFLVAIRNVSRALLFWPTLAYWHELRFTYWFISGLSQLQVVVMYYALPLKISENWFSSKERSLAWSAMMMAPVLGGAIAALIIPHYILNLQTIKPLAYLNIICLFLTAVVILSCITKSKPKHPPSARRAKARRVDGKSMGSNLKSLFSEKDIMIQMIVLTVTESMTMTIGMVIPDILASAGLSQVFTGEFLASSQIAGVIFFLGGSLKISCFTGDKNQSQQNGTPTTTRTMGTKSTPRKSARTCKIYLGIIAISSILYITILSLKHVSKHQWWLAITGTVLQTSIRSWSAPIYTNMVAQLIAGSISEASYMAIDQVMFCLLSSFFSFVFMLLRQVKTRDGDIHYQEADYSYSLLFSAVVIVTATIIYISCFRAKSKTLDEDEFELDENEEHGSNSAPVIRVT